MTSHEATERSIIAQRARHVDAESVTITIVLDTPHGKGSYTVTIDVDDLDKLHPHNRLLGAIGSAVGHVERMMQRQKP